MDTIWNRLRRRKVVQWAAAYAAAAWALLQVVDLVGDQFGWPVVVLRSITALFGVGLLVVLVLAWYHGERGMQRVTGLELAMLATLLVMSGGVLVLIGASSPTPSGDAVAGADAAAPDREAVPRGLGSAAFVASVAVLPLDNLGAAGDDFLTDGITEEIIAQLAQVSGLKVISRTSVVALRGSGLTLPEIADTLGVDHVLEGSVRRAADRARVTVQLIEAASDAHLWARSYDRPLDNLFEVQQEIATEVARALIEHVPTLGPASETSRTASPAAYEVYLRGRQLLHRRTRESLLAAGDAFAEAARMDPRYAPTFAAHAATLALWPHYGYAGGPGSYEAHARAIALADTALALDPRSADALAARGLALTHSWAPAAEAAADFVRAVEIQRNSADIHGWYAHLLTREQDFDAALAEAQRAIELDPIAPGRRVGYVFDALGARRYDLVLREARAARAIEPTLAVPRAWEGLALLLLGRAAECLELDLAAFRPIRAMCLHAAGSTAQGEQAIRPYLDDLAAAAAADGTDVATAAENVATYFAWLGDRDRAFEWLDRAFDESPDGVDFRFVQSGLFDRIRGDAEFQRRFDRLRQDAWLRVERMAGRSSR